MTQPRGDDLPEPVGDLRLELWTNKGDRGLVFGEGEELKLYMRVNRSAYVRLIYVLANGAKVPLEQAYFLDKGKVNRAVEYVDSFEVTGPFGVEQIFGVAFEEKPRDLPTRPKKFGGETYDVVVEAATMVRHRGLKKKKKKAQIAEAMLTITTTPR